MKRFVVQFFIAMLALTMLVPSCQNDETIFSPQGAEVPDGYIPIRFKVDQSDLNQVDVRSVDPDGQDINTMSLFCFNAYGLFLATASDVVLTKDAEVDDGGHHTSGIYSANIPEETAIIHFIANQNPEIYRNESFINETEAQVLANMEGASGMMIYWARFAKNDKSTYSLEEQLDTLNNGAGVKLLRNQAKVTIKSWNPTWTGGGFTVTGYVTTNIHAFGTVAPFCPEHGFAIYSWPSDHVSVTLPDNKALMSDIVDINTKSEDYIFEHENTLDNPISVIIKGRHANETKDSYYRVMIMDNESGDMIPILRNHHYVLNIKGPLSYGKSTFEEALNGPATNNVWVSVDSWVKEVADSEYKLTVSETSKVFHESKGGTAYSFTYTLTKANGTPDASMVKPEVTWLDGNNVARHEFVHTFNPSTGEGAISVTLLTDDPNTPEQTGTLMIRKGRLYRTINVSMISTQKFTPSWVAAQVYGGTVGEHVTLKFTIPETCPESLFPFPVMVSVNDLDVRSTSGMELPVRLHDEASWYGDPNDVGYKYEYIVDGPGVHRLYFHSILPHANGETIPITIEANFFEKLEKQVVFANHNRSIRVEGLQVYDEEDYPDGFSEDELIKYLLVPQKINAPVMFSMRMKNVVNNTEVNINADEDDEFMLYSKTLDYGQDEDKPMFGIDNYDCTFYDVDEVYWKNSSNGRVMMFMPNVPTKTGDEVGLYKIYMKTNRPMSQDVIRLSSNQPQSKSAHPDKETENYSGNSYRSTIFELGNYRPFRFAAQVIGMVNPSDYKNNRETDEEEVVSNVLWDYAAPGKQVNLSFDVTSFQSSSDNNSVNPFGTEFEIYIDAPMLEIDESRLIEMNLNSTKLKEDPNKEGRFIYTVHANREAERTYGTDKAKLVDNTAGVSQAGERKTLPFKTKKVTSAGEIKISSDKEKVIYYDKTFKIRNNQLTGNIHYDDGSGVYKPVPKDAFVAFVRKLTRARIGSVSITEDGRYSLNLRSEYTFNWTDEVEFDCKIDGVPYEYTAYTEDGTIKNLTLQYLFNQPDIVLVEATSVLNQ